MSENVSGARACQYRLIRFSVGFSRCVPPFVSAFLASATQLAINGQYGIELLLQIIAAFLAFIQLEFKATFFVKALTLSLRQLAFQLIYPLDIGLRARCYRWRLGIFDRRRWR